MTSTANILFVSHGGGPMPLLVDPGHKEMVETLKVIAENIVNPSAILVISAHWEERVPTITSARNPQLIYDYYGFPKEAYEIQYPCSGEPKLARQLHHVLNSAGIQAEMDDQRGFDHGVFVPLKLMYPDADIPCIQLSLVDSLNAKEHLDIGRALQALEWENLLVVGSGFSFHNLRAFFARDTADARNKNQAFEDWLKETMGSKHINETERQRRLIQWEEAPYARFCHPREEHLLPLHVCYGMAGTVCNEYFQVNILNKKSVMFYWPKSVHPGRLQI